MSRGNRREKIFLTRAALSTCGGPKSKFLSVLAETRNQFSLTRAALSRGERARVISNEYQ